MFRVSRHLTICPERGPNLKQPQLNLRNRDVGYALRLTEHPYGTWAISTIQRLPTPYEWRLSMRTEFRFSFKGTLAVLSTFITTWFLSFT